MDPEFDELRRKAFDFYLATAQDMRSRLDRGADAEWIRDRYLSAVFGLHCEIEIKLEVGEEFDEVPLEILKDAEAVTWREDQGFYLQ
jgi:hypothetical protein